MPGINRLVQAIKEPANLVGLASAASLSLAMGSILPALAGAVLEAAYLLFVPDSRLYGLRMKKFEQQEKQRQRDVRKAEVLPTLRPEMRDRYLRLEGLCNQLGAMNTESNTTFLEAPNKFDYLLDKFLTFAGKEATFCRYLYNVHKEVCGDKSGAFGGRAVSPGRGNGRGNQNLMSATPDNAIANIDPTEQWIQQNIADVQAEYQSEMQGLVQKQAQEQDPNTKAVLAKRVEVLQRRDEFLQKIGKTLINLHHQLALLEDTFGLISDEVRARSPEQLLDDVNDVISQTDSMTRVLDELAPYEQMASRIEQSSAM